MSQPGRNAKEQGAESELRNGLTLGEWLSQAVLAHEEASRLAEGGQELKNNPAPPPIEGGEWTLNPGAETGRIHEALERLSARLDQSERRQALVATSLDRSVLGLAARVEDAESGVQQTAEAVSSALNELKDAESDSKRNAAQIIAELEAKQEALQRRFEEAEADARSAADEALASLRREQQELDARVRATEANGRSVADAARHEIEAARALLEAQVEEVQNEAHRLLAQTSEEMRAAQRGLGERFDQALQSDRSLRDLIDTVRGGQDRIEERVNQIEQSSRESATNLRNGAASAIAQVRSAQVDLEKRLSDIETRAPDAGVSEAFERAHEALAARLEKLDAARGQDRSALHVLDAKVTSLAASVRDARDKTSQDVEALKEQVETIASSGAAPGLEERLDAMARNVDEAVQRLASRLTNAEAAANDAIRSLEDSVHQVNGLLSDQTTAREETAAVRNLVENRLDGMAQSFGQIVGDLRDEMYTKFAESNGADLEAALGEVNRRLAAAEKRQGHTIEAISIEIRRLSESMERRLRALETRNDDAGAVREELALTTAKLEERFSALEVRDTGSDRIGAELARLSERVDHRFDDVERRSAEAIEHVGEQVARVAERFTRGQDSMAREVMERLVESEERHAARLQDALQGFDRRLTSTEERSADALTPFQKAMSSLADRLQLLEDGRRPPAAEPYSPLLDLEPPTQPADEAAAYEEPANPFLLGDDEIDPAAPAEPLAPVVAETFESAFIAFPEPAVEPERIEPELGEPEPAAPPEPAAAAVPEDTDDIFSADAPDAEPPPPLAADELFPWEKDEPQTVEAAPKSAQSRNDYLAAARRAAQSSAQPQKGARGGEPTEKAPLRGPNRIVLWGAAGAMAAALASGAVVLKSRMEHKPEPAPEPARGAAAAPATFDPLPTEQAAVETPALFDEHATAVDESSIAAAAAKAKTEAKQKEAANAPKPAAQEKVAAATPQAPSGVNAQAVLSEAASKGDAVAQYDLALRRIAAGQKSEGVALLRRSANQGLAMAQYRLAKLYERGEGVTPDLVQAREWTERAAAAGNRKAMHDLGVYYARGEGASLDEGTAFRWFKQAAELGVADSQYNLGVLYQQGRGVSANPSEALFWFTIAARSGDGDARARAATLEAQIGDEKAAAIRQRADNFQARPSSARANGDFGERIWSESASRPS